MSDTMSEKEVYRCPLCGYKFTEDNVDKCSLCPMAKACDLIMCPNCSYEFPKSNKKERKAR
ncbi:MAG: hypothetical protein ACUVXA_09805 [Candidatus Jordarchaeum sp.]|uniref:hypothetical protein n=1 Tax=Candidatus Jordarchaeum sp. TaxID=2823881 RepID=UPI00404B5381